MARVSYATSLMRQGVLISTTEHLLSTLYSFAIDNAYIEIDNLEVPILDGSGKPFVDLLRAPACGSCGRKRQYLRIRRPVTRGRREEAHLDPAGRCFPADLRNRFPAPIGKQSIEMEVTPERYAAELSPGPHLRLRARAGTAARNGSDSRRFARIAPFVSPKSGVLNPEGLRFPDECCRHKALDLIGDLALIGRPLLGHVIAERAGHAMHTALVAKIMSDPTLIRNGHVRPVGRARHRIAGRFVVNAPGARWHEIATMRRNRSASARKKKFGPSRANVWER